MGPSRIQCIVILSILTLSSSTSTTYEPSTTDLTTTDMLLEDINLEDCSRPIPVGGLAGHSNQRGRAGADVVDPFGCGLRQWPGPVVTLVRNAVKQAENRKDDKGKKKSLYFLSLAFSFIYRDMHIKTSLFVLLCIVVLVAATSVAPRAEPKAEQKTKTAEKKTEVSLLSANTIPNGDFSFDNDVRSIPIGAKAGAVYQRGQAAPPNFMKK